MLIKIIALFLGISLLLYCLFAGADFGAGILECFSIRERSLEKKGIITRAMGPVWEANHVWLILAVVILLNGFPRAYAALSVLFHIPLTLILIGIIMRGCSFTFRHYDAVKDDSQSYYSFIFRVSSILTPFMLGVVAGGVFLGRALDISLVYAAQHSFSYYQIYVEPWLNVFCISVGVFTCTLFAFLAAVYLSGETQDRELKLHFVAYAKLANIASLLAGAGVFIAAEFIGFPLFMKFIKDPLSLIAMGLATLCFIPIWNTLEVSIKKKEILLCRLFGASQVMLVLLGWFKLQYPVIVSLHPLPQSLTLYNSAAPPATLRLLGYALGIGGVFIFPSLIFLLRVFKWNTSEMSSL